MPDAPESHVCRHLLDKCLSDFTPAALHGAFDSEIAVCEHYCSASIWTSSGLLPVIRPDAIINWLQLEREEGVRVSKSYKELTSLQGPWIELEGAEGKDGEWERQVCEVLQMETLGRFVFAILLAYIREKVQ
jgi:hypothetical protein